MFQLMIGAVLFLTLGCSKHTASGTGESVNEGQSVKQPTQRLAIGPASAAQCPAGGMAYTLYGDADANGSFSAADVMIDQQVVCNGVNGANGANGANGQDGASMVFETLSASPVQCSNGGSFIVMAIDSDRSGTITPADSNHAAILVCNGGNGSNGQDGVNGRDGANGHDGADGQNGSNGADGQDAILPLFTPVEAIQACGNSVAYKEVLLRLANGQVLGSFSDDTSGKMTRLAFLPDGTYMNTDNSGCTFSLSTAGDTRSISWGGQVQKSWQIVP